MYRGPHENYVDRQDGAPARVYSAAISDLHTPYIAPSENGGREGVRWLALLPGGTQHAPGSDVADSDGADEADNAAECPALFVAHAQPSPPEGCAAHRWGVRGGGVPPRDDSTVLTPAEGLHFSASYHSTMDLLKAKHEHELESGPCRLHLDGMHMGVGGDDSWTPSVRLPKSAHLHAARQRHGLSGLDEPTSCYCVARQCV